ncbi:MULTISPECIES: hypothetical protein [Pseudomonas]|uniref:hypothetical protein n=1 Tax=Pseudomonas TaxID=286 RepID=UPI0003C08AB2|nr:MULTISPECIES: hypothetical protein [Pseudomonas]AGZ37171.1 hypothetical protein PVLB_21960 [Pseudomonas sp. VLB120]AVD88461.1 hypothetical protein C4Q26_15450 [Pseudomonas sp. SWI44]MDT8922814.1 hypothetical protein [Pseudomonas taiwanensis]QQZ35662.1 hypothetical protein IF103_20990 [Pseudomonas sp. SK2]WEZ88049.1 hypothetical protein P3R38_21560 [Pseudomonas sp. NyZ480]
MKRQRGMVLLLALVLSLLLALIAASALRDALLETRMTGYLRDGLQALEQVETTLQFAEAELERAPPALCKDCQPPSRPHELQGAWQGTESGYFQLQNLGASTRAAHRAEGEEVTLYRVTAVSRQSESRQVVEAVYAVPAAHGQVAQRILWRQRLRRD